MGQGGCERRIELKFLRKFTQKIGGGGVRVGGVRVGGRVRVDVNEGLKFV